MPLPININALLHGQAVESERMEFKEGWNPQEVIQAICAFANDFHNWGGGYLVLGVKTENGKPVLPPVGIRPEQADDRQNAAAPISELQPSLIQSFLAEVKSDLQSEAARLPLEELGRRMQIVRGPVEAPRPLNVGLLFFTPDPSRWFPQTQIDVVHLPQGRGGDQIIEKTFKGPVGVMLRDALGYLRNNVVTQYVTKRADRAEAERFHNVPYAALEEALVNAIYHRSYEEREPVEVQITPDEVTILSFPGPDLTVRMEDLRAGRAVTRRYRNRRIGEFLKELELSEGRGTGIPKILNAMRTNGSAEPIFETDADRLSFLVRLPFRPAPPETTQVTAHDEAHDEAHEPMTETERKLLAACAEAPKSAPQLLQHLGYRERTGNFKKALFQTLSRGLLEMTLPAKPRSRLQKYRLTDRGRAWLAAADTNPK